MKGLDTNVLVRYLVWDDSVIRRTISSRIDSGQVLADALDECARVGDQMGRRILVPCGQGVVVRDGSLILLGR